MTRYGQLGYTSFDARDGNPGGWQVKETVGNLSAAEVHHLTSRVATQLDSGSELPRFPTPEQISRLPRRLRHAAAGELGPHATATWHTAPAGFDASGRPGNVFAHVLLDRGATDPPPNRPILSWRSPDWLTPYGAEQVRDSRLLRSDPPRPGALTPAAVADLIFAPRTGHLAVLQVLLDATLAANLGGPPVVLGVADLEDAARWIAAVHLLMSPGTAARQWFSTLERADTLSDARALGLQLMVVPVADLDALENQPHLVVLDADEPVELGDLNDSPHRTQRGDEVDVTPWSVIAAELLEDPEAFERVTRAIDEVAGTVGDQDLYPAWPLAKLVADGWDPDVLAEAHRVLDRHSPPGFVDESDLRARTGQQLRRETGGDLDRAWRAAANDGATTLDAEVYAELALADDDWLAAPGPARIPRDGGGRPGREAVAACVAAVQRVSTAATDPSVRARTALHLLELGIAVGAAWDRAANNALVRLCHDVLIPALLDPEEAGDLLVSVQYAITDGARQWLWTLLDRTELTGMPGQRVPGDVVEWLAPRPELGELDPLPTSSPFEGVATPSDLTIELAWSRLRNHTAPPEAQAWALVSVLEDAEQPDPATVELLGSVLPAWPTAWATQLARHRWVPIDTLLALALHTDDDPLWQVLARRPDGTVARARLRVGEVRWWSEAEPDQLARMIHRLLVAAGDTPPAGAIHADLGRALALVVTLGGGYDPAWLTRVGPVRTAGAEQIARRTEEVPEAKLLWWLLHGDPGLDLPAHPEARWLQQVTIIDTEDEMSVIEAILVSRWRDHPERDAQEQADHLRGAAERAGARLDRRTERWLRTWSQHRRRKEGFDAHLRT